MRLEAYRASAPLVQATATRWRCVLAPAGAHAKALDGDHCHVAGWLEERAGGLRLGFSGSSLSRKRMMVAWRPALSPLPQFFTSTALGNGVSNTTIKLMLAIRCELHDGQCESGLRILLEVWFHDAASVQDTDDQ